MRTYISLILLLGVFVATYAQTVPAVTGSKIGTEDAQQVLDFHNKVRADVGAPALEWSGELAEYAQAWADHLAKEGCKFEHRPRSGTWTQKHGENIFWGSGKEYSALHASESWYSEIKDYRYAPLTAQNSAKTGHYSQMVWKSTTHVGIGISRCKDGETLIVANYNPPGNWVGQKPY